jgi:hypothetical protein
MKWWPRKKKEEKPERRPFRTISGYDEEGNFFCFVCGERRTDRGDGSDQRAAGEELERSTVTPEELEKVRELRRQNRNK